MPTISGTVKDSAGAGLQNRIVRAYRRETGALIGATTTAGPSGAFTVTTSVPLAGPNGDPSFSSVSLLLNMNGANGSTTFTDSSSAARSVTVNGNTQISTAQSKFGGASALLDGNQDWLYAPAGSAAFGTGDFTIEGWFYWNSITNAGLFHIFPGTPASSTNGGAVGFNGSEFFLYAAGTAYAQGGTQAAGAWTHVAYVRSSGIVRLYVNGVQQGASRSEPTNFGSNGVNIGLYYSSGFTHNGYIDDVRVTIGVARYTGNFTPPTAQHPAFPFGAQAETWTVVVLDEDAGSKNALIFDRVTPV